MRCCGRAEPNLVQTSKAFPPSCTAGPFANIAHGCNSVIATNMALAHADWAVTEAGFGSTSAPRSSSTSSAASAGLETAAIVLVATDPRAQAHGGLLKDDLATPEPQAVERGLPNLEKHIENSSIRRPARAR
jgi:formate--tetrahydrofolate ligase